MNIDDLIGKTVVVKQKNNNCQFVVCGKLEKDIDGFNVFVYNNGASGYVQFNEAAIVKIQDCGDFYYVNLK